MRRGAVARPEMMLAEEDAFKTERLGALPEIKVGGKMRRRHLWGGILGRIAGGMEKLKDPRPEWGTTWVATNIRTGKR